MTYGQPPAGGYGPQGQPPQQWGSYGQSGGYPGGSGGYPSGPGGYPAGYGSGGGAPMQAPSNYLVWSIICIFLCWPLAIPAIVFANQVNSKFNMGDYQGAQDASSKAKMFSLIATIVGAVWIVFWIIFYVVTIASVTSQGG